MRPTLRIIDHAALPSILQRLAWVRTTMGMTILVHWEGSILVWCACCWLLLIAVGDEEIKRRRHIREQGASDEKHAKRCFGLGLATNDIQRSCESYSLIVSLTQYVNIWIANHTVYPFSLPNVPMAKTAAGSSVPLAVIGRPNVRASPTLD